jgi:8-oxo-dGTP pyrophosphatase MutT (NUDIX family)
MTCLPPFPTFVRRLRARLAARPLPGPAAQQTMAMRYRATPDLLAVEGKDCREAGVLALLVPLPGAEADGPPRPAVVLTQRRDDLPDHAGQIAFPGGRREPGETYVATALREADEEVNLDPSAVDVLGALTPLYIPPSNFCVHPFVGVAERDPPLRPTDAEVRAILRVPLATLLAPATRRVEPWTLGGRTVDVPFYDVDGHAVWGATAMMLAELLACCRATG